MWIYGRRPVLEAAKEGRVRRLLVARGVVPRLERELERLGLDFEWTSRSSSRTSRGSTPRATSRRRTRPSFAASSTGRRP